MCVRDGSKDLYTSTCPMCKFFRNSTRCHHKREVCRNRANHPRHDVVFIANAEVVTFKGCGYCKWAVSAPPPSPSKTGGSNPGWPGCCRPPLPAEIDRIPPADWPAVHSVHRTPIPSDIKAILDSIKVPYAGTQSGNASLLRGVSSLSAAASERKSLVRANSSPGSTVRGASGAVTAPQKSHRGAGGSPQPKSSSLSGSSASARQHGSGASPISHASAHVSVASADSPIKRVEGFRTTPPGIVKKLADGEREHPYSSRTTLAAHSFEYVSNGSLKRRSSTSTGNTPFASRITATFKTSSLSKNAESRAESKDQAKAELKSSEAKSENAGLERSFKAMSMSCGSSSDSSSTSSGGSSDGTVTSDGGFTDYLSDESEAELQRQAEARALMLEQNRTEEAEFRQARQQLAAIDLRPPQLWREGISATQKR